jgi:hypothetical protein
MAEQLFWMLAVGRSVGTRHIPLAGRAVELSGSVWRC